MSDANPDQAALIAKLQSERKDNARLRAIADRSPNCIARFDRELRYLYANRTLIELTGAPDSQIIGRKNRELPVPRSLQRLWDSNIEKVLRTGKPCFIDFVVERRGKEAHLAMELYPEHSDDGQVEGVACVSRDVTKYEQAEEELLRFSRVLEESLNEIYIFDAETLRFDHVNHGARENLGYSMDELRSLTPLDIKPDFTRESFAELVHPLRTGERKKIHFTTKHQRKDGTLYPVEVHLQLFDSRQPVFVAIILDITERIRLARKHARLEEQYQQSQKLEAIGRLAGGVAHDFNNILCTITGNADLALDDLSADAPLRESLQEIKEAAARATDLTQQLLAFSRKQVIAPRVIDINRLIESMHPMLARLIGEDIVLRTIPQPDAGPICADPNQIEQVVLNLAINARDAMPKGGELLIETADVFLDEDYCSRHAGVTAGFYVMIAVSDTGCGMSAEVKKKIFEPFYTTKELGQGTGLGLATVFGIVEQSGGRIEVYSEEGRGSSFKVYFPRVADEAEAVEPRTPPTPARGHETLLVVEDEEIVRRTAVKLLEHCGYEVLEAKSGQQALAIAREHQGSIALLLTDVVMPRMNGRELARELVKLRPEIKVLYTSGYTQNVIAHHGVLDTGLEFLPKPYSLDALASRVRQVLDDR